jgi:hypothetical protein
MASTKKSTKIEEAKSVEVKNETPSESVTETLRKLCDRTTGKMMRVWFQAELEGQTNPKMLDAIKELANAKKSFLAGSSGKRTLITHLDRLAGKIGGIKEAQPHLLALRKIIDEARGMPAEDFARLIDEIRGHWLQEGPKAD